jgi:hypothetical protein
MEEGNKSGHKEGKTAHKSRGAGGSARDNSEFGAKGAVFIEVDGISSRGLGVNFSDDDLLEGIDKPAVILGCDFSTVGLSIINASVLVETADVLTDVLNGAAEGVIVVDGSSRRLLQLERGKDDVGGGRGEGQNGSNDDGRAAGALNPVGDVSQRGSIDPRANGRIVDGAFPVDGVAERGLSVTLIVLSDGTIGLATIVIVIVSVVALLTTSDETVAHDFFAFGSLILIPPNVASPTFDNIAVGSATVDGGDGVTVIAPLVTGEGNAVTADGGAVNVVVVTAVPAIEDGAGGGLGISGVGVGALVTKTDFAGRGTTSNCGIAVESTGVATLRILGVIIDDHTVTANGHAVVGNPVGVDGALVTSVGHTSRAAAALLASITLFHVKSIDGVITQEDNTVPTAG